MGELYTAVNEIIGDASSAKGLLYYTNWSTGATPGTGAPHALTLNRKIEGIPPVFEPDPETYFPGVYVERSQSWPSVSSRDGKQYVCNFDIAVHYIADTPVGRTSKDVALEMAVKLTENIMGADKLGIDYISGVYFAGIESNVALSSIISRMHTEWAVATARFMVQGAVIF